MSSSLNVKKQTASDNEKQTLIRFLWLHNNFFYCMALTALVWIVALCYYIENFIGWSSISALPPADFGLFLLSATLPLGLFWFILAYIERNNSLDANATLFQNYVNNLIYPTDEASQHAKAISNTLKEQISLLQKENLSALNISSRLKTDLDSRISDFSKILQLLDNYSGKTLSDLNDGVKTLYDRCSYITEKTMTSVSRMQECSHDITFSADSFLSKVSPLLDEISATSANIKNNIADNTQNMAEIKKQLALCSDISQQTIDEMLAKTEKNTLRIEQAFYKTTEEYNSLYKHLDASISGVEGKVEEQKRLIGTQTQVLEHNSELLSNKLAKYGQTLSAEIDKLVKGSIELEKFTKKQISSLKSVNAETSKAVRGIEGVFDEKRAELESRCEYAVNSIQNVIIAINKETDKLISFTNLTQTKNTDLQNITETMVEKINAISSKLELKTDSLKGKAVDVIDKFTEAQDLITHSSEKINNSASLIVNNGKQGVKLLEEQNFYINNTLTNIEMLTDKLAALKNDSQKTVDELTSHFARYENLIKTAHTQIEQPQSVYDVNKLIEMNNFIRHTLQKLGLKVENFYTETDMFDLWDSYIKGNNLAFTELLSSQLTKKQTFSIRKAFDDQGDFHSQIINYLFMMDLFIKDVISSTTGNQNELINLAVRNSLDKLYFILIKALNNAE